MFWSEVTMGWFSQLFNNENDEETDNKELIERLRKRYNISHDEFYELYYKAQYSWTHKDEYDDIIDHYFKNSSKEDKAKILAFIYCYSNLLEK